MRAFACRGSLRRGPIVSSLGLLALVALLAAPAGAYTIVRQELYITTDIEVDLWVCSPSGECGLTADYDGGWERVSGPGSLFARIDAVAELYDETSGLARMSATMTGASFLDPEQIRVAVEYSVLLEGSPTEWDILDWTYMEYHLVFTVSEPTAYSGRSDHEFWEISVFEQGTIVLEPEGIMAPGTYELFIWTRLNESLLANQVIVTLEPLPEPGTALLLGLGAAALAGRRGARAA
jgi:hypothetical protein